MKARIQPDEQGGKPPPTLVWCRARSNAACESGRQMDRIHPVALKDGPVRFNDLSRMIEGASKKMITERLRQLQASGSGAPKRVADSTGFC